MKRDFTFKAAPDFRSTTTLLSTKYKQYMAYYIDHYDISRNYYYYRTSAYDRFNIYSYVSGYRNYVNGTAYNITGPFDGTTQETQSGTRDVTTYYLWYQEGVYLRTYYTQYSYLYYTPGVYLRTYYTTVPGFIYYTKYTDPGGYTYYVKKYQGAYNYYAKYVAPGGYTYYVQKYQAAYYYYAKYISPGYTYYVERYQNPVYTAHDIYYNMGGYGTGYKPVDLYYTLAGYGSKTEKQQYSYQYTRHYNYYGISSYNTYTTQTLYGYNPVYYQYYVEHYYYYQYYFPVYGSYPVTYGYFL